MARDFLTWYAKEGYKKVRRGTRRKLGLKAAYEAGLAEERAEAIEKSKAKAKVPSAAEPKPAEKSAPSKAKKRTVKKKAVAPKKKKAKKS